MPPMSGLNRFFLAFVAFFKVWFDRTFAENVWALRHGAPQSLPSAPQPEAAQPARIQTVETKPAEPAKPAREPGAEAVALLAVLQRDVRLVDFLQEDLAGASDADLAAVVRSTVYEGCRKSIAAHLALAPVLDKPEGAMVTVEAGFDPAAIRLTGNVVGNPPFRGTLKHRGWKATKVTVPEPAGDGRVVAPAEVELP